MVGSPTTGSDVDAPGQGQLRDLEVVEHKDFIATCGCMISLELSIQTMTYFFPINHLILSEWDPRMSRSILVSPKGESASLLSQMEFTNQSLLHRYPGWDSQVRVCFTVILDENHRSLNIKKLVYWWRRSVSGARYPNDEGRNPNMRDFLLCVVV